MAGRERRQLHLRAPITGLVLMLIVVLGTYWGWQNAFGSDGTPAAADGCSTTPTTTTTTTTTTPRRRTPPTTTSASPRPASSRLAPPDDYRAADQRSVPAAGRCPGQRLQRHHRRGLANDTAALLKDRGFEVLVAQNDPLEAVIPDIAQIRAARADTPEVRLLIQHVPGAGSCRRPRQLDRRPRARRGVHRPRRPRP